MPSAWDRDKVRAHVVQLTFHVGIVHSGIPEVCGTSRLVAALALGFHGVRLLC